MWTYFEKGGPVMWPLLALSILGVAVAIWRWWTLRQVTRNVPGFMKELRSRLIEGDVAGAISVCERFPSPVSAIVKAGLLRYGRPKDEIERALEDASAHELAVLERGLPILATIAMVAPLLGFLGTVTGMINSFEALASVGLNNPAAVAKGISEALITTAAGLIIAIPIQMVYNYFVTRVNVLVRTMESAATVVLEAMSDAKAGDIQPDTPTVEPLPIAGAR
ncbi:MAG TPA: MotA/TolQ/ExbB proton channel family protein [Thermoanaerobaculia bacterium]|nr:MotA/TolQ/ExbB proton channel family protein [Thermoanaerobaculia bacterium]